MQKQILTFLLTGCLALGGLLTGCAEDTEDAYSASDIHILVALPFTGAFRSRADNHQAAIQMAVRDLEASGQLIDGASIKLHIVDATADREEAEIRIKEEAAKIVDSTGANLISAIISSTSAAYHAALPLAMELNVPQFEVATGDEWDEFISIGSGTVEGQFTSDGSGNVDTDQASFAFSGRGVCRHEATLSAYFIREESKAGGLFAQTDRPTRLYMMRGTFTHDGIHTAEIQRFLEGETEVTISSPANGDDPPGLVMEYDGVPWREHLQAVMDMPEKPDVIFFHLNGDSHNFSFFQDAKSIGFDIPIVTCGMAEKPTLLDPVNPGVIDYLGDDGSGNSRLYWTARSPYTIGNDRLAQFRSDYQSFAGENADTFAASAYDVMMSIGLAIAAKQSRRGVDVRDGLWEVTKGGTAVNYGDTANLVSMARSGGDVDYEGASGPFDLRYEETNTSGYRSNTVSAEFRIDETLFDGEMGMYAPSDLDRNSDSTPDYFLQGNQTEFDAL